MFEITFLGTDGKLFPGFVVDWSGLAWADAVAKDVIEAGEATAYQVRRIE